MRKILDSLLAIIIIAMPFTGAISCGISSGKATAPAADYNLNPYLMILNKANFKAENPDVDLKKYEFINSWFSNISFTDWMASYTKNKVLKEWNTTLYKSYDQKLNNQSDTNMQIVLPSVDITIPNGEDNLKTEITIDNSNNIFTVFGDNFKVQNKYVMSQNQFLDDTKEDLKIPIETFMMAPHTSIDAHEQLTMHHESSIGITSFYLNVTSQISYQIKDLKSGKISTRSYYLKKILDDSNRNSEYKDFLLNSNSFLNIDKNTNKDLIMNLPSVATMITNINFLVVN